MATNKFNISDFVKMATSGWTPEVFNNAMDRIEKMNSEVEHEEPESIEVEHEEPESIEVEHEEPESTEVEHEEPESTEVDEKDAIIASLQAQVKDLQNKNVHQSATENNQQTDEDILNNALMGLLS